MRQGERDNAPTGEGEGEAQQQHQESLHSTRRAHTRTHNVSDRAESSNDNGNPLGGPTRQLGKHKKRSNRKRAFEDDARDRSDKMKKKKRTMTRERGLGEREPLARHKPTVDDPGWRPCQVPTSDRNTPKRERASLFWALGYRERERGGRAGGVPGPHSSLSPEQGEPMCLACVICTGGQRTSRSCSLDGLARHDSDQTGGGGVVLETSRWFRKAHAWHTAAAAWAGFVIECPCG